MIKDITEMAMVSEDPHETGVTSRSSAMPMPGQPSWPYCPGGSVRLIGAPVQYAYIDAACSEGTSAVRTGKANHYGVKGR